MHILGSIKEVLVRLIQMMEQQNTLVRSVVRLKQKSYLLISMSMFTVPPGRTIVNITGMKQFVAMM